MKRARDPYVTFSVYGTKRARVIVRRDHVSAVVSDGEEGVVFYMMGNREPITVIGKLSEVLYWLEKGEFDPEAAKLESALTRLDVEDED